MSDKPNFPEAHPFRISIVTPQQVEAGREERHRRTQAAIEARQKREAEQAAAKERQLREEGQQRLESYRQERLQRFLDAGGTVSDFQSVWPRLKAEWLIEQTESDPKQAKVEQAYQRLRASGHYEPLA
jgi:hypothetical protein